MTTKWQEDILKSFVKEISPTKQFTDSFDDFVKNRIREVISLLKPIHAADGDRWIKIKILGGTLKKPAMLEKNGDSRSDGNDFTPQECRLRNLTYGGPLYVDFQVERSDGKNSFLKDVYIGRIPIMVFSSMCHLCDPNKRTAAGECDKDPGGYMIINGQEKSMIGQKIPMNNRMITYLKNGVSACAVKSERRKRVHVTTIKYKANTSISCTFPRLEEEVPLMVILMAMGVDLNELRSVFTTEENALLEASFRNLPSTVEEAKRRIRIREVYNVGLSEDERLQNAFENVLVPHMKMEYKAVFLVTMVQELLAVATGKIKPTDRDSVANQRVETACSLMTGLFLHLMIKVCNDTKLYLQKAFPKLKKGITDEKINKWVSKINTITDGFQYSLATGNWNTTFVDRQQRKGVAQALQRLTYISTVSQLRRVSSAVEKTQKLPKPRYLHGSHWGRYCPAETPEGAPCGLENQLTVQSYISIERDASVLRKAIQQFLIPVEIGNLTFTQVFINGTYEGSTKRPKDLVFKIRKLRRTGQYAKDMSITHKTWRNHIHISTTAGRICRPLMIVEDGKCVCESLQGLSFTELCNRGAIEYLDCEEEDSGLTAFFVKDITPEHTHCEISNAMMNGLCAATIPFSDRNPGTRNTYQCAMAKQAQGVNAANFQTRMDTTTNIMWYGQKPLVGTKLSDEYGVHDLPSGINAIVAIMPFMYNQEDSIIINQSALDRGFARADTYKTIKESLSGKENSKFEKPKKKRKVGKYNNLEEDGLVRPGTAIKPGDCVIGKVTRRDHEVEDESKLSHVKGTIDKVIMYQERNGDRAVKVRVRQTRVPVIGDKFSSRHGQKGTAGMFFQQEDMPFTIDGIVPDIIINPHAIPSRMTIGHMIECLAGKVSSLDGNFTDASPFNGRSVKDLMEQLKSLGFNSKGNETLYSGITGEKVKAEIFMGPTFYQRLKHNVEDKIHARGRGKRNALTHQPNDGRINGGGLRVGEMEKDSFNAHGVPYVINERMCVSSDAHTMKIKGKEVTIPYAAKLLFEELKSMCINVDLRVK